MENELICLDSTVLIEYFRKTKKEKSFLYQITQRYSLLSVSIITQYEIYIGSNPEQDTFWGQFFRDIVILPFDVKENEEAVNIFRKLKAQNKLIDIPDLLIGATALTHSLKLATINKEHFSRIEGLDLIVPE